MLWYQVVFLALIQGLTEFLPVSSSAHLILPAQLLSWPDQGLSFDVAVHVGTLIAVVSYFYRDIISILRAWCLSFFTTQTDEADKRHTQLGWYVAIATIPAGLIGILLNDLIESHLRSVEVIAYATIGFGILLWVSDRFFSQTKEMPQLTYASTLMIGFFQALALIPGTSRSGITITAARFLGFSRDCAARFSFLLSIPLITVAGGYKLVQLLTATTNVEWGAIITGVALSMTSAYLCIHFFLKWINSVGFTVFLLYRLLLGFILLAFVYW